jgi:hypothetical protein
MSHALRSSTLFVALFVGAAIVPSSLRAQESTAADSGHRLAQASTVGRPALVGVADAQLAAGRRIAPAGIHTLAPANPLGLAQPRDESAHVGAGSDVALMGAGAAAVVVGLLIGGAGGTLVALGGGVIGLVGLYRFLR